MAGRTLLISSCQKLTWRVRRQVLSASTHEHVPCCSYQVALAELQYGKSEA